MKWRNNMGRTKKLTKQEEANYRREAIACIIVAILGWFFVGIILEPLALWRGIYVKNRTTNKDTASLAVASIVISGVSLGIVVLALLVASSNL